jgi:hypothetical protein
MARSSSRAQGPGQSPSPAERRKIAEYEKVALSDADLVKVLGDDVKIVMYPDLHRMRTLDEVMGPGGAAIILFEAKPEYGHWCTVFRAPGGDNGLVEFFNPYGGYPDDSLRYINKSFAERTNQDEPYLSRLMMESPYRLSYSPYAFQSHGNNVKTCGRHCAARLMLKDLPLDDYKDWITAQARKTRTDADAVVSAVTSMIGPRGH